MTEAEEEREEKEELNMAGGRKRRSRRGSRKGSRRGSRKHRKGTKKRSAGKWIMHVKKFAKDNKMSFKDAMSSSQCKSSYKRM